MTFPKIEWEGKEMYQVACKKCRKPDWGIFSDGKGFVAGCSSCGHQIKLKIDVLKHKPDKILGGQRMDRKKLNLPSIGKLEEETKEIIRKVWSKLGSIRKCKDVGDFGVYRYKLVELFDKEIKDIKKEIGYLNDEKLIWEKNK